MIVARQFGRNLRAARERAGISQEELSFRAEVHRTQISKFERGKTVPRIDTFVRLVSGLRLSPCDLLEGLNWKQPTAGAAGVMAVADEYARTPLAARA